MDVIKNNVFFKGIGKLDLSHQKKVKEICYREFEKIERKFKHINKITINFKEHNKGGTRSKYSLHMLIDGPSEPLAVSHDCAGWDSIEVIHEIFNKAKKELNAKFKSKDFGVRLKKTGSLRKS